MHCLQGLVQLAMLAYKEHSSYAEITAELLTDLLFMKNSKRLHRQFLSSMKILGNDLQSIFKTEIVRKVSLCKSC